MIMQWKRKTTQKYPKIGSEHPKPKPKTDISFKGFEYLKSVDGRDHRCFDEPNSFSDHTLLNTHKNEKK